MTDILDQIREAFDAGNSFYAEKNIALRKAHSEIERLRREEKHLRDLVQAYSDMARSR